MYLRNGNGSRIIKSNTACLSYSIRPIRTTSKNFTSHCIILRRKTMPDAITAGSGTSPLINLIPPPTLNTTTPYSLEGGAFYPPTSHIFPSLDVRPRLGSKYVARRPLGSVDDTGLVELGGGCRIQRGRVNSHQWQ